MLELFGVSVVGRGIRRKPRKGRKYHHFLVMGIICSRQLFCGLSGAQQREGGGGGLNNDVAAVCYRGGAVNGKRWWEE